jgi:hypothetical protein
MHNARNIRVVSVNRQNGEVNKERRIRAETNLEITHLFLSSQ